MRMSAKKRYAVVGMGSRSRLYTNALLGAYREQGDLVGLCDVNHTRMRWHNDGFVRDFGVAPIPTYDPERFGRMLRDQRVDVVIVTTVDRTHHRYILEALKGGCDVIT